MVQGTFARFASQRGGNALFALAHSRPSVAAGLLKPANITRHYGTPRRSSAAVPRKLPLAFALDIDGVLLRGPDVLPSAMSAIRILEGNNPYKTKIPYILLTNGGGMSEEARVEKLSKQLGCNLDISQYIQAHTVMKQFVCKYKNKHVLVLGGKRDVLRHLAEDYGFRYVHTTLDVLAWNPAVWPFHQLTEPENATTRRTEFSRTPIAAIFVFHDPRNWALDVQVLCDVIQSGGIIGGPYINLKDHKPVDLIFCNPDLLWRSDFPNSRLGQGAFKEAFQGVFKALTGNEYPYVQLGKPTKVTYDYAKAVLEQLGGGAKKTNSIDKPPRMYMIGDNPESDIAGANAAGWNSILVKTGVWDPERGPPTHPPTHIADDVKAAVLWAIENVQGR
ncbi:HAD-superfamily hydrolase [Pluteus cervinus]|uniref:HAD-superfamily hydrolase n=1 Tax=Pluteus cervinus TaxID=181527 RepID=A0ACD3B9M3_9AGAR|nr:HAD-superfamily hydrolase [Pluteus cervinus]